ncbi:MAG: hypothetical protein HZA52_11655 [Planctomycetes bacterium]|nr:hypothetical protein [Planctomycetota bacterium]
MAEPIATYTVQASGLWNTRHRVANATGTLGVLTVHRGGTGVVESGSYRPEKGEVLTFRRDPGILRGQFSVWTEGREWLGSSLRWSIRKREINLHTGNKPLRLVPLDGLRFGWSLQAPKTGEMARIHGNPLTRRARIDVFRKVDFELLVFAYFLGSQIWLESLWPGPELDPEAQAAPAGKTSAS